MATARKDLTGNVCNHLKAEILRIIERAYNPQEASDALIALLDRMPVPIPILDDDTSADFVISSMVVSQLITEATESMIEVLQQRGWRLPGDSALRAWFRLKGRVQRAHVTALAEYVKRTGKPVYLASEVVRIPRGTSDYAMDPEGRLFNEQGKPLPHLVDLLDGLEVDLLPVDEWEWDFDGSDKVFFVEALMIVSKGTAAQWRDLAKTVERTEPPVSPPATTGNMSTVRGPSTQRASPKGRNPTRAAGESVVEMRDRMSVVEGNLALTVVPATSEESSAVSSPPLALDIRTYAPTDLSTVFDLRTYAPTHLRTKLLSLAQSRGLGDVAGLLVRLTDDQLTRVLKASRSWKKILERNGLGDGIPSIREEKISAADRLFLALAGLSRSRRDVAEILARIQPGQETSPPISPVIGIPAGIAGMARGLSALPVLR